MSTQAPTDDQLCDLVRFLARTCVEVERGLRPPDQLAQFIHPDTLAAWRNTHPIGRFAGGPLRPGDVGVPHITRIRDDLVRASITTRTDPHRWGALVFELRQARGRWAVANLQRLLAATHYRTGDQPEILEVPLEHRIEAATSERTLVEAAHRATRTRLAELAPSDPARQATERLAASWERIRADLDRELNTLRASLELRQTLGKSRGR